MCYLTATSSITLRADIKELQNFSWFNFSLCRADVLSQFLKSDKGIGHTCIYYFYPTQQEEVEMNSFQPSSTSLCRTHTASSPLCIQICKCAGGQRSRRDKEPTAGRTCTCVMTDVLDWEVVGHRSVIIGKLQTPQEGAVDSKRLSDAVQSVYSRTREANVWASQMGRKDFYFLQLKLHFKVVHFHQQTINTYHTIQREGKNI